MRKWWIYWRLKKKLKLKKLNTSKIFLFIKQKNFLFKHKYNAFYFVQNNLKELNCYPTICKKSNKFKKNIKLTKTTRWVFFKQLKNNKISNIHKYVW